MARTTVEPLLPLPHPQQRQRLRANRAWGAVAAVLILLVMLLRPSSLFGAAAPPPPERVDLTLLAGATEKGAGTLAADYLLSCMNPARDSLIGDAIFFQCAWMEPRRATTCREAPAKDPTAGSST
jgi:hypothetical protein